MCIRDRAPRDADENASAVLEVRAGTGGDEAAIFAGDLFRMYSRYAQSRGWRVEVDSTTEGDAGGYKESIATVTGEWVCVLLKFESGVHRVQRVPATEAQGRIHTSAATVAVLPEVEDVEIDIQDKDIRIDTFRASGSGGQHVNKTDSAVRITHLPTGSVNALDRDSAGFIWIASTDGLARYDGNGFRVWRHEANDPRSLTGNWVQIVHVDGRDRVWASSEFGGLSMLDGRRDGFRHWRKASTPGLGSDDIFAIASRGDILWFGTCLLYTSSWFTTKPPPTE